jgi:hypothetical protein
MPARPSPRQFQLLKKLAAERGLTYSGLRTSALRGEFPVVIIGGNEHRRGHMYAPLDAFDAWLNKKCSVLDADAGA